MLKLRKRHTLYLFISVLTDSNKRIIYDMFGEEGLSTSWEVGPRLKTPQEVGVYVNYVNFN